MERVISKQIVTMFLLALDFRLVVWTQGLMWVLVVGGRGGGGKGTVGNSTEEKIFSG